MSELTVTAVAPWAGSNRMLAHAVGQELRGCNLVGVTFAGGMSEVVAIDARTINVNDKHAHIINMATVMADKIMGPMLYREVRREPFHPMSLDWAQQYCLSAPGAAIPGKITLHNFMWAKAYFIVAWMTRHGTAGTPGEFTSGISTRWVASGGDSNAHYRSAVRSIPLLRRVLAGCNFTKLDFRDFLAAMLNRDRAGHGIYSDPPFPGGHRYTHSFTEQDHIDLRNWHERFTGGTRIVIRYYDVPFVRELYCDPRWHFRQLVGRKQTNAPAPELLIINGESYADPAGAAT